MAEKPELAPKYYLEYFNYLLDFVQEKYKNILNHEEWKFLRKYYCLSEDAQCLFIRFTNRKGLFFKTGGIKYQELVNIPEIIEDLKKKEFIEALDPQKHQLHLKDIIGILTKADLIGIFGLNAFKNLKREDLDDLVMEKFEPEDIIETIGEQVAIVKVNFEFEVAFLRYLFFGNRSMDMTEFVVRDLGFVQYYGHNDDQLVARFNTRKDADDKWLITDQHEIFSTLKDELEPPALFDWFLTLNDSIKDLSEIALPGYERLILKIGQHFERKKHYELAIETFEFTSIAPSRERRVRCFQKLGKMEEALAICQTMLQTYQNADERFFAEDFIRIQSEKKTRNKKSTTTWLHLSDEIEIDGIYRHQVEAGTMQYYLDEGHNAAFSENHLWRAIFGLMFWEIIFDPSIVSFHHPFQRRPSDLHLPDFYEKTKSQIQQQLNRFEETGDLIEYLQANYHKNMGIANPFVVWLDEIWVMVEAAVTKLGMTNLRLILERIAENIVENSRGLPDLFIWSEYHYEFVEVKSPTDNLSNQQLYWLRYFKEIGVNAKVLRVKFRKD